MRIKRHQFPIAPDYARTAYATQGFTLDAAIVDLNYDARTDPVTGYVALSRVRCADDILILQPFEKVPAYTTHFTHSAHCTPYTICCRLCSRRAHLIIPTS